MTSRSTRPLTTRETFAGVLAQLIQERCAAVRGGRISRTGLQAAVPVQERPAFRRGIDALIDHGVLLQSGQELGLTPTGTAFARQIQANERTTPDGTELDALFAALQNDDRLDPHRPFEDIRTLPARLENFQAEHRSTFWRNALLALVAMIVVVAVVRLG